MKEIDKIFDGLYRTYSANTRPERPLYFSEAKEAINALIIRERVDECNWWKDTQHFGLSTPETDKHIKELEQLQSRQQEGGGENE